MATISTNTTPHLDERTRLLIVSILLAHAVRHASLFGSFARGDQHAQSDIDLIVELPPGKSLFDLSALGIALEDALGRHVDLVTAPAQLHLSMREHALREQVVLS